MKKHFKRGTLSVLCLALAGQAFPVSAIGLLEAYQAALKNDPMHRAAKAELLAGLEYEAIGRSSLLPQIQYGYSTRRIRGRVLLAPTY